MATLFAPFAPKFATRGSGRIRNNDTTTANKICFKGAYLSDRQFPGGVVVQEEKRFCAGHDKVVHTHGHEVDANPAVVPGYLRNLQTAAR